MVNFLESFSFKEHFYATFVQTPHFFIIVYVENENNWKIKETHKISLQFPRLHNPLCQFNSRIAKDVQLKEVLEEVANLTSLANLANLTSLANLANLTSLENLANLTSQNRVAILKTYGIDSAIDRSAELGVIGLGLAVSGLAFVGMLGVAELVSVFVEPNLNYP